MTACYSLLLVSAALLSGGCDSGGDIDRVVVRGTVTYNDEPVADGMIRFVPTYGSENPVSGGAIVDGKYEIKMRGGVPVGAHRVEINSFRKLPKPYPDMPEAMVPKEQLLPEKFNVKSELQQEIPAGKALTLDFPLRDLS